MREYCVGRDIAARRFAKDDLAVGLILQEAYEPWVRFASDLKASAIHSIRETCSVYQGKVCDSKADRMEADVEGLIVGNLRTGGRRCCAQGCIVAQAGWSYT
jgi:hypothetical protein